MKANIEFDLNDPEDYDNHAKMLKANEAFIVLNDIQQEIFRPARKHGFNDKRIENLLDKCGQDGYDLIALLEEKYCELMNEYGLFPLIR